MNDDHYYRSEFVAIIPPDLRVVMDDVVRAWEQARDTELGNMEPPVTVRLGPGEGCQPPLLHTYRREDGERCQCGEREWPAELQDD